MGHPTLHVHRKETLLDGPPLEPTLIELRTLRPDDYRAVITLADDLTGGERYVRYFTTGPGDLSGWASTRDVRPLAMGAFEAGQLIGVAKCRTYGHAGTTEIAIVVAEHNHQRRISTALLRAVTGSTANPGLHQFITGVPGNTGP